MATPQPRPVFRDDVWQCPCGHVISETEMRLLLCDVGCARCRRSLGESKLIESEEEGSVEL